MDEMHIIVRRRRLKGLVVHHRLHTSAHPRRLVRRTSHWGEAVVRGVCRWCGDPTATLDLTWHRYCLDAYRVASGQKPDQMQVTMCEGCGGAADEVDHRLAINVARALGPQALRRAFTQENLRWLCHECHRRKTRLDWRLARYLRDCSMDWRRALRALRTNRVWIGEFLGHFGIVETVGRGAAKTRFRRAA